MRPLALAAALSVLLLAAPLFGQDTLEQASAAYRAGDFRKAAQLFSAAADQESDSVRRAEIRVQLAVTYFNMKNRAKAEESLAQALADNPQLELLPDFYGPEILALFAKVKAKATSESRPVAAPMATPRPAAAGTLPALRQRLAQAVDSAALEQILNEVQQVETTTAPAGLPEVLDLKAEVLDRLGRSTDATEQHGRVAALRAAAQASPGTPIVPLEALLEARRLIANGGAEQATALMRGVLAVLPSCFPALEVLGEAQLTSGQLDDAFSTLRTAMLGGEKPELWLLLGEVDSRRGRLQGARDAFRRAVEGDPGSDRALAALGLLAARMDDVTSARDALDRALQVNGTLFEARVVRAQIALLDGQPAAALQHLQRALQIRPNDSWATGWSGAAYLASGNADAAADRLRAGGEGFQVALAEALRRQGKAAEALKTLAAARGPEPDRTIVRARCELDDGDPDKAVAALRELAVQRPQDATVGYLLGAGLFASRSWAEAATELARAAALSGAPPTAAEAAANAEACRNAQLLIDTAQVPVAPPPTR